VRIRWNRPLLRQLGARDVEPISRAGEALLHAERVGRELGDEKTVVHFRVN
jgi:hypothetical protein